MNYLSDSEYRSLRASQDREQAYEVGFYGVCIVIGLVLLFVACGGLEWAVGLL